MKKLLTLVILLSITAQVFAQQTETEAIKKSVNALFESMRNSDSALLKKVFYPNMVLQTVVNKKDGTTALVTEKADDFIKAVGSPHAQPWDERITFGDIKIDGDLASVWTPYKFYLDNKYSHCGVNFFQLMKTPEGWKIIYIVDTRRKDNCPD